MNDDHHVAWADRIGLNRTWAKAIEKIWVTYGTDEYYNAVMGLYSILINIKNGPQLRTVTDEYVQEKYVELKKKLEPFTDTYAYRNEKKILEEEMLPDIATFMIQLLEDNGFGFYESTTTVDSAGLDD